MTGPRGSSDRGRPSGGGRRGDRRGGGGPPHRGGPRPGRPPERRPSASFAPPPAVDGEVEALLLEARGIAAEGDLRGALACAGEGVRRAPERPEGYLVLGDLNLEFGDLREAGRCFDAAAKKAPRSGPSRGLVLGEAAVGRARVARLRGDVAAAVVAYREALAVAEGGDAAFGSEAAETFLLAGDAAAASELAAPVEDATPDEHLVAALALRAAGKDVDAVVRARLALFGNLYLLAAALEEDPPDLGLTHGLEEARPEHAKDVAERLRPYFDRAPEAADFLAAVASTPLVAEEVGEFVACARALGREADAGKRADLSKTIERLRDPARIRGDAAAVLAQATAPDDDAGACFDV